MIAYYSNVTKNTERFVAKTGLPSVRIEESIPEDCILVIPTYGQAAIPVEVLKRLQRREDRDKIRGVIGTGNINFGSNYCAGATQLAARLGVPLLYTLELAGTDHDVRTVIDIYERALLRALVA